MPRFALEVAYDGTDFQGSQGQKRPGARTVDGTLKTGLELLLGQQPKLLWASRTDSGVHACGNVCVFDADLPLPADRLPEVLNARMPKDLRIVAVWQDLPADFHPRFDATQRAYRYQICAASQDIQRWRYYWELETPLDLELMQKASSRLLGRHSFSAFADGSISAEDSICDLQEFGILADLATLGTDSPPVLPDIRIWVIANRFLRHMVCRLVGAVVAVGQGKLGLEDIEDAVRQQKKIGSKPAPPRGLTLMGVYYQAKLG